MWKKICFFIVAGFFMIAVGYLQYSTFQVDYVKEVYTEFNNNKQYHETAKIFNNFMDTNSIIEDDCDKADIRIYPGALPVSVTYVENNETVEYTYYDPAYHLYIFDAQYSTDTFTYSSGETVNYTSVKFNGATNSYTYYYVVNDTYNSNELISEPQSLKEALLNNVRNYVSSVSSVGFLSLDLSKPMLDCIETILGEDIVSISLVQSDNVEVYTINVDFSFEQQFFKDAQSLLDSQNNGLDRYEQATTEEERTQIREEVQLFLNDWIETYCNESTGYFVRTESVSTPAIVIVKTAGVLLIFILVVALVYIAFFKRHLIKKLYKKITNTTDEDDEPIAVTPVKSRGMIGNVPMEDFDKFVLPEDSEETVENK